MCIRIRKNALDMLRSSIGSTQGNTGHAHTSRSEASLDLERYNVPAALSASETRRNYWNCLRFLERNSLPQDFDLRVVGVFPDNSHDPIVYPVAGDRERRARDDPISGVPAVSPGQIDI
jgi:hypothetical protein